MCQDSREKISLVSNFFIFSLDKALLYFVIYNDNETYHFGKHFMASFPFKNKSQMTVAIPAIIISIIIAIIICPGIAGAGRGP